MPNAAAPCSRESGVRDLGIHTEMLTDGLVDLYKSGLRDRRAQRSFDPGKSSSPSRSGSPYLYDTITRNPDMLCLPVDYTNLPHVIMQNDRAVSINNTTQIDLQGQAASESDGHRHLTGTGGQLQFVRGAYASHGGKSFICLVVDLRAQRRAQEPHRTQPDAGQHRHDAALRHDVRRHRIRHGQSQGEVSGRAGRRR